MSFDCKYKVGEGVCRRLPTGVCKPGSPGCVLYGRFYFPFHDDPGDAGNAKATTRDDPAAPGDEDVDDSPARGGVTGG